MNNILRIISDLQQSCEYGELAREYYGVKEQPQKLDVCLL